MENPTDGGAAFEELLAACIEAHAEKGAAAVEAVYLAHPEQAQRLRARLRDLDRLGLLGGGEESAPQKLGPYTILRRLGQGGMSEVFLARDKRLGRVVALKSAFPSLAHDQRSRERFDREVQAIAQVSHPAIIPVYDAGEAEGRPYFTMEYVEGLTLAQLLEHLRAHSTSPSEILPRELARIAGAGEQAESRTGSPWQRSYVELVCRWTLEIAEALAHAHAAGIVHRDVKPSNIMLRPDGHVQLFDFGLARLDDQPGLTRSGEFAGTPYYVSPEQLTGGGKMIDAQSDVYSLGVTLYELLTFRRPFEGRSTAEVLHRIQSREAASLRQANARVPRDLELICRTALDRDRGRRYQSMEAFADDLRNFLAFEPIDARPLSWLSHVARLYRYRPALAVAYTLGAVIVIGLPIELLWTNAAIRSERDSALASAAEARRSAALSNQMVEFLVDLFELGQGESADLSARELLSRGLARIPTGRSEEPLVRAALLDTAGRVYANLGMHEQALRMFDRAFARLRGEVGDEGPAISALLHRLARTQLATGDAESARSIAQFSIDGYRGAQLGSDARLSDVLMTAARADRLLAEPARARERLDEAWRIREQVFGAASEACARVRVELGALELEAGRAREAILEWRGALSILDGSWTPDPLYSAGVREQLADALEATGDAPAAAQLRLLARTVRARIDSWRSRLGEPLPALPYDYNPAWREAYDASFQTGITALQSNHPERAREAFERCLELVPSNPISAYNLACAFTQLGQREVALDWLERAVEWGFGQTATNADTLQKDLDLWPLRSSPRFARAAQRILEKRAELERESSPVSILAEGEGARPLLVVLHRRGSGPSETASGPWGAAALRAGLHCWVPSAVGLTGGSTRDASWYASPKDFEEHEEEWSEGILAQLRALLEDGHIDRGRVWIAAEGDAGPLATSLALNWPGLFRRLILLEAAPDPKLRRPEARAAALNGVRVDALVRTQASVPWAAPEAGPELRLAGLRDWFLALGLETRARELHGEEELSEVLSLE